jgi:hypothetical protein
VEDFCEHGNEISDFKKCSEILEYLSAWRLLKNSAPRSWFSLLVNQSVP